MLEEEKKFLEFLDTAKKEKEKIEKKGAELREKLYQEIQAKIQENYSKNIEYAQKILDWARNFYRSEAWGKAKSLIIPARYGDDSEEIHRLIFFSIKGRKYNIPSFSIRDDGLGYCGPIIGKENEGIEVGNDMLLSLLESLAGEVPSEILKQVWESIESGAVYQTMRESIKWQLEDWKRISYPSTS